MRGLVYPVRSPPAPTPRCTGADHIERVILLGPAHWVYVLGSAPGATALQTPLGQVAVDESICRRSCTPAHAPTPEHSLEVQLPVWQRVLPKARVTLLLTSDAEPEVGGDGGAEGR